METKCRSVVAAIAEHASAPEAQIVRLLEESHGDERVLLQRITTLGLLSEVEAWRIWARALGLGFENPDVFDIEPAVLAILPEDVVRRHRCIAIRESEDGIVVAMEDPLDLIALDTIQEVLGGPAIPVVCPPETLRGGIEHRLHAGKGLEGLLASLDLANLENSAFATPQRLQEIAGEDAIVELVDHLITQALRRKASDVHVEPATNVTRVRVRVDGRLETAQRLPKPLHPAIVSRIKVLAEMDIAERRRPQDGRFRRDMRSGGQVEFRVSTLPGVQGEKVVLRILDRRNVDLTLDRLGLSAAHCATLRKKSQEPNGMILVTGPTGSGKTTTLYGLLSHLNSEDRNLLTVEDPVEYELAGTTQVQVSNKAQRGFATALRSILRQDPDVIMVGEIRDQETAEIAVHAALTGHMVLSTLHTNSAIGTVTRLIDMGIAQYLLAPSLRAIVAQRLVRRLCPECSVAADPSDAMLRALHCNLDPSTFKAARGCRNCRERGFVGRIAIHEMLVWNDELARALSSSASEVGLCEIAHASGFEPMLHDGLQKASEGLTTLEEVASAVRA
ncbi:MAG: type II/IV secretion system protein [Planctomycetes bacterium]|nr:type II/IV secretion system protein [Planctomycetota bacterium]